MQSYVCSNLHFSLLLGRKVMTNLESILKSRDITLPTKVRLVKAIGFPVVMYGCESWTIKKAECWGIDAFEMWCWRRLLRVPWICKEIQPVKPKGNKPWIFIERTDAEAETPILWPTWCNKLTHCKRPWCWERLKAGREGDNRGWDGCIASPTPGVHSNSCPSSHWCHPAISSSVVPFSSCL